MRAPARPAKTRADQQLQHLVGRASYALLQARDLAESISADGLAEDCFMLQVEVERIRRSLERPNGLRRYSRDRQHVSENQEKL